VSINKRIRTCSEHAAGRSPMACNPPYLMRTCPTCMVWLGQHPEDARLARHSVPGKYASPIQGAYNRFADRKRQVRAAGKRAKARAEYVPPRFEP